MDQRVEGGRARPGADRGVQLGDGRGRKAKAGQEQHPTDAGVPGASRGARDLAPGEDPAKFFQVAAKRCEQCLFTSARIVPEEAQAQIVEECRRKGNYFVCHKGSLTGNNQLCCRGFYDTVDTTVTRLAHELGLVRFVPVPKI